MTQIYEIDVRPYVFSVPVAVRHVHALSEKLEAVKPADIDAAERAALDGLKGIASEVLEVLNERDRSPADMLGFRRAFTGAWNGIQRALLGAAGVSSELGGHGDEASALLDTLFPEGVTFANREASAAWAEGVRRVNRFDGDHLREPLVAIIGAELVGAAEKATRTLGEAVLRTRASKTALREKRAIFSRALGKYGRVLAGKVDEEIRASVDRFKDAVAPMDEYRISRSKVELDEDILEPVSPTDPVTPVPPIG